MVSFLRKVDPDFDFHGQTWRVLLQKQSGNVGQGYARILCQKHIEITQDDQDYQH